MSPAIDGALAGAKAALVSKRNHARDIRAATRLAVDATREVTDVVEAMHRRIAGGPSFWGSPLALPVRIVTAPMYWSIRTIARMVGAGVERVLAESERVLGESEPGVQRDAIVAALNGVLGDYLVESKNPLAMEMELRYDGKALPLDRPDAMASALSIATSKVLVLAHGSSMSDRQWKRRHHEYGAMLANELGYTPIYLRYNSGLHISENGRAFAKMLEKLIACWPVPIDELAILGHSMGGLVARSAALIGEREGQSWVRLLRKLIFVGTPHHGAPLERIGNVAHIMMGVSEYSAPIAKLARIRSAGVTDLRFGYLLDEQWQGRDRFGERIDTRTRMPLPEGVACYAIAGTTADKTGTKLGGDGMVPVESALGRHAREDLHLAFPEAHCFVVHGVRHLDLLGSADVYAKIVEWLR